MHANIQLDQWQMEDPQGEDQSDDEDDVVAVTTGDGRFDPRQFAPAQMLAAPMLQQLGPGMMQQRGPPPPQFLQRMPWRPQMGE